MIDKLMPIVTLFQLIIKGVKEAKKNNAILKKRSIYRKLLAIQLLLEDIIDKAQDIISFIRSKEYSGITSKEELDILKNLLYSQRFKMHLLIDNLEDDSSVDIMRIFTPIIRRRIIELIHMKGGFLGFVLHKIGSINENTVLTANELLLDWDHDDYIEYGDKYTDSIVKNYGDREISIFKSMEKQERIINELIETSKELSLFIRENIDIGEVLRLQD